jgi:hypothetical protein
MQGWALSAKLSLGAYISVEFSVKCENKMQIQCTYFAISQNKNEYRDFKINKEGIQVTVMIVKKVDKEKHRKAVWIV